MVKIMENPIKMDDLGVSLYLEISYPSYSYPESRKNLSPGGFLQFLRSVLPTRPFCQT